MMQKIIYEINTRTYDLSIHGYVLEESDDKIIMADYNGLIYQLNKMQDIYYLMD